MIRIKVEPRDTLSGLALTFLRDAERWKEIADLNQYAIATENIRRGVKFGWFIYPGQFLLIDIAGLPSLSDRAARRIIANAAGLA